MPELGLSGGEIWAFVSTGIASDDIDAVIDAITTDTSDICLFHGDGRAWREFMYP